MLPRRCALRYHRNPAAPLRCQLCEKNAPLPAARAVAQGCLLLNLIRSVRLVRRRADRKGQTMRLRAIVTIETPPLQRGDNYAKRPLPDEKRESAPTDPAAAGGEAATALKPAPFDERFRDGAAPHRGALKRYAKVRGCLPPGAGLPNCGHRLPPHAPLLRVATHPVTLRSSREQVSG